ncbi:hypothetical protein [Limosilactobacillus albertensis]|uniref:MFS transporter n=1 Tax=Limosilactobacillus albertensis TaxID=2759752 RepID=A0A839H5V6_9LACO|nr:hypothetical protein [Limosilactobacillus albertensis]MBB1124090.1 hypothetical protein [Limosilactobacillus albertensis]MCD7122122.1 hypothetical protein [Limosilactobacillus albertensis]
MKRLEKFTGVCSLLLNLMPFIVYISLTKGQSDIFVGALPFAIFYAFRHTILLFCRDLEYDYQRLAWIGLYSGVIGYLLGIFGGFQPILWDLSGVGAGIASQLFPTAINQQGRLRKQGLLPPKKRLKPIFQLVIVLVAVGIVAEIKTPAISFALMLIITICAMASIWDTPRAVQPWPVQLRWANYLLALVLLGAMLLLRLGRSLGIGQPLEWGSALLLIFLITMILVLILNRRQLLHYPNHLRLRIMLYGVCGQYWTLYSTVFIGALYGTKMYSWTIIAYLFAFVFGGVLVKQTHHLFHFENYQINLVMLTIGILLTFWLPTYFIGIFIIRSFAGAERKIAINDYEKATHNYNISLIVNYYYASIAGIVSQLVMWGSLFIFAGTAGMNKIFGALSLGKTNIQSFPIVTNTHVILAGYMILFVMWLAFKLNSSKKQGLR